MKRSTLFSIIGVTLSTATMTVNVHAAEGIEALVRIERAERLIRALSSRVSVLEQEKEELSAKASELAAKLSAVELEKLALAETVSVAGREQAVLAGELAALKQEKDALSINVAQAQRVAASASQAAGIMSYVQSLNSWNYR